MYRQMPVFSKDHNAYFKQMYEWHSQMARYEEQLRSFHLERANQFQTMVDERQNVVAGAGTV